VNSETKRPAPADLGRIFLVMLRIGATTFGGGYAMIPQMSRDFVSRYRWIGEDEIVDLFAVAQSTPGVIALNASLLVGYRIAGAAGALAAALGALLPSLVVLSLVTVVYQAFLENPYVLGALRGVRAAVAGLLFSTVVQLRPASVRGALGWLLFVAALAVAVFLPSVNAVWILLGGGLIGLLSGRPWRRGQKGASS
jgi:chromate transporter